MSFKFCEFLNRKNEVNLIILSVKYTSHLVNFSVDVNHWFNRMLVPNKDTFHLMRLENRYVTKIFDKIHQITQKKNRSNF